MKTAEHKSNFETIKNEMNVFRESRRNVIGHSRCCFSFFTSFPSVLKFLTYVYNRFYCAIKAVICISHRASKTLTYS